MTDKPSVDDKVRQLLVHPVVWPDLVAWLDRRGIDVGLMPAAGEDDLPTYVMTPSDALFAAQPAPRNEGTLGRGEHPAAAFGRSLITVEQGAAAVGVVAEGFRNLADHMRAGATPFAEAAAERERVIRASAGRQT